jgi:hypothetical protein
MRGQGMALAAALLALSAPLSAQSPTAEQAIETAREVYTVTDYGPQPEPCPEATNNEIIVCQQYEDLPDDMRVSSPTERANEAGEMPPDPIPAAPDLYGGMRGGVVVASGCMIPPCPPPYPPMVDFSRMPEGLTPEEAAHVIRAEDLPEGGASPAAALPAAAP